ncbi:ABC transporter permease [Streptomyces sp. NP160]|uniref:ABC transporter permease n=1 Tax=Streptomyces sp. NP160 TaxID=2586637 RepID=UPI00111A70B1|nr:ABC transporter permease [Streptomyces sp. NP160]TNM67616.1 ABC transporter permease [Streptomyces sp. NP160]
MTHSTTTTPGPANGSSTSSGGGPAAPAAAAVLWGRTKAALPRSYLLIVLVGIVIIGFIATPDFLTVRNATNVISFSAIVAVLAVGQFFVVLTGGIDLSVGSTVAISTVVSALLMQQGVPAGVAVIATLAVAALVGLLNGVLVVVLGLAPFIATLATLSIVQGASYIIQSTSLISISNTSFVQWFSDGAWLGLPNPVSIFLVVMLIAAFVAKYTTFGRRLYAIGGNREAARLSGLPVSRDLMTTYILSGLLAGLAGLLAAAQLLQGSSLIGQGYELDAIAAVVVGGASLFGGKGDPISAVIGCFVISIITNIMNLIGISSEPQLVIKGAVIIIAVFLSSAGGVARIRSALRKRPSSRSGPGAQNTPPVPTATVTS